ncbi:MAG TPA: hypothetical protein VHM70_31480 [Polyangiaceae bacterium]|nr:hypothetical protein [Polyangiaceae bacterium]
MWVRATAIRPVPAYARVPEGALEAVRMSLADDEDAARAQLDQAFERFEREQPCLAAHIGDVLAEPLDETALALGYFLALATWLAFDRAHGNQIEQVGAEAIAATQELLELDEELRRADPSESLDTDDIIGMEQPELMDFVHEHVNATLESNSSDIEVDDVDTIYRVILVEILALSYSVYRPAGYPVSKVEIQA